MWPFRHSPVQHEHLQILLHCRLTPLPEELHSHLLTPLCSLPNKSCAIFVNWIHANGLTKQPKKIMHKAIGQRLSVSWFFWSDWEFHHKHHEHQDLCVRTEIKTDTSQVASLEPLSHRLTTFIRFIIANLSILYFLCYCISFQKLSLLFSVMHLTITVLKKPQLCL